MKLEFLGGSSILVTLEKTSYVNQTNLRWNLAKWNETLDMPTVFIYSIKITAHDFFDSKYQAENKV
jgi:hypothetical protein